MIPVTTLSLLTDTTNNIINSRLEPYPEMEPKCQHDLYRRELRTVMTHSMAISTAISTVNGMAIYSYA